MKIHLVFHINLLRPNLDDPLSGQITNATKPVKTVNENEWLVNDILNSRRHYERLQYKIKWNDFEKNDDWYNTDRDEFTNSQKIVDDFHSRYPEKAEPIATKTLRSKKKST